MPFKNRMRNNSALNILATTSSANINAEIIKQRITMPNVISYYGFHTNRSGFMRCPFHEEKTPSLKIYPEGKGWYCYGCGAGGSVIDFVMKLFHVNFSEAVAKLDSDFCLGLQTGPLSMRDKQKLAQKQAELQQQRYCEQTARRQYEIMYRIVAAKYRRLRQTKPPGYSAEKPFGNSCVQPTQQFIEALQQLDYLDWWLDEYNHFERWQRDYGTHDKTGCSPRV